MNKKETVQIVRLVSAAYPTFKPDFIEDVVAMWFAMLQDYEYKEVEIALKSYIATNSSPFAPSVGELLEELRKLSAKIKGDDIPEAQAWDMVREAMKGSIYNSQEEFAKLPKAIRKAVGSPSTLFRMATDNNWNEGVESSNFFKNYRRALEDEHHLEKMPVEIRNLIGGMSNGNGQIGNTNQLQIGEGQSKSNPNTSGT